MKIVYVNTLFYPVEVGGAEKSLRNLIAALVRHHGITPVVVTLNDRSATDDVVEQVDGATVHRLGHRNTRFVFGPPASKLQRALWHLKDLDNHAFDGAIGDILRAERPDLVHTNNLLGFSARPIHLARRLGIPVVHTLRDYYFQCWKSSKFVDGRNCQGQCLSCSMATRQRRAYSQQASCVVGNSAFILADHRDNATFSEVPRHAVIYNIYEPDTVCAPRPAPASGRIRLGYMGRLNAEKGIRELVDVVKGVAGFELVVAGEGAEAAYVQAAAAAHGNISYLGYAPPQQLVAAIDVLVVPSLWNEPLSRTIFEAYSYGVPVVGSACGGTPEIIDEGATGAVFDTADFGQVLVLAARLCAGPGHYEQVSANCLAYARRFTGLAISTAYANLYADVVRDAAAVPA